MSDYVRLVRMHYARAAAAMVFEATIIRLNFNTVALAASYFFLIHAVFCT